MVIKVALSLFSDQSWFFFQLLQNLWRHPAGQKKKWKLLKKVNIVKLLFYFRILVLTELLKTYLLQIL